MTGRARTERRVVITGMGAITPSGLDVASVWDSVSHGRSAIRRLEDARFSGLPVRIGGAVRGFDPRPTLSATLIRRLAPSQQWAVAAADQALAQAQAWAPAGATLTHRHAQTSRAHAAPTAALRFDPTRVAIFAATCSGPVDAMQAATRGFDTRGARGAPGALAVYGAADAVAATLSERYGIRGSAQAISATCASGPIGLGEGMRWIRHGYADAALVVGVEDCLNPVNLAANANLGALAHGYEHDPQAACRPFDRDRSGFVMSAGAAAILLEAAPATPAAGSGTGALVELAGFGAASDAYSPVAPSPAGAGAAAAIQACLEDAGLSAAQVDHVNAHGTGTRAGDAAEIAALETALGARGRRIPISATKSSTGHLIGASGVLEAILAVMSLRTGLLPPTLNLEHPEYDGWDFVTGAARAARIDTVLSSSFGFGGHNGALLLRRWEDRPSSRARRA